MKGTTARAALRQSDAAHRGDARGHDQRASGLQNPGVDAVIAEEIPEACRRCFHKKVDRQRLAAFPMEEYVECAEKLDALDSDRAASRLNISCPNVHGGGMSFGARTRGRCGQSRAR